MTTPLPLLSAQRALLFVTTLDSPTPALQQLLATTLLRLQVQAEQQDVVRLAEDPEPGRQFRVRITPCLVLDTGGRIVQLPGEPALLEAAHLERALTR
jgi:hypothetical protein